MSDWTDHAERRMTLGHIAACRGRPSYPEGCDQTAFCAEGCITFNDGDFHLPVGKLAEFVTTLYEAAGKPAPVILDRPEVAADGDGSTGINIFTVKLEPDLRSLGIRYHGAPNRAIIAPGPARVLASVIAAYADAGQAHQDEPDPAEVEELAAAIRAQLHPASGKPSEADRTAARAALRYLRGKQQREKGQ